MKITVNGEKLEVPEQINAAQLLEITQFSGKRVAMEINLEIVPRSLYEQHVLKPDDTIEIVQAIGGG